MPTQPPFASFQYPEAHVNKGDLVGYEAGVGRQFPQLSLKKPDGHFGGKGSFTSSATHVPSYKCCPSEHPDGVGIPAIGMGDGLVKTGEDGGGGVQEFPHSALSYTSIIFRFLLFFNKFLTTAVTFELSLVLVATS